MVCCAGMCAYVRVCLVKLCLMYLISFTVLFVNASWVGNLLITVKYTCHGLVITVKSLDRVALGDFTLHHFCSQTRLCTISGSTKLSI